MPTTKEIVTRLRQLATGTMHADIDRSTLFQDAAAEIERLDKALYEEKEKTRQLMWEVGWWKTAYEHRDISVSNIVPDRSTEPHSIDPDSPLMTE